MLLKPRERELVSWLTQGLSDQQIADWMGLQRQSVKNLLHEIYRKVGVKNRIQLVVWALRNPDECQIAITPVTTTANKQDFVYPD